MNEQDQEQKSKARVPVYEMAFKKAMEILPQIQKFEFRHVQHGKPEDSFLKSSNSWMIGDLQKWMLAVCCGVDDDEVSTLAMYATLTYAVNYMPRTVALEYTNFVTCLFTGLFDRDPKSQEIATILIHRVASGTGIVPLTDRSTESATPYALDSHLRMIRVLNKCMPLNSASR